MNKNPSPATVLRRAIERAMRQVRVALPGMIESYDAQSCTATIQVQLLEPDRLEDGSRAMVKLPPCNNVPVYFTGGGGSRLTFPCQRGDTGVLLFSSSSIDRWLALGGEVDPEDQRHHHLSDAIVFLVGVRDRPSTTAAHATATVLEGSDVRIGDASAQSLATKADVQALRDYVNNQMSAVGGHVHAVAGAATTTITTVAVPGGTPPNVSPAQPAGTTKAKGT